MPTYELYVVYSGEYPLGTIEAEDAEEALRRAESKADDIWPEHCTSIDYIRAVNTSTGVVSDMEN